MTPGAPPTGIAGWAPQDQQLPRPTTGAPPHDTPRLSMSFAGIARACVWFAFPVVGMLWIATRSDHNWYHFDEWTLIERTTTPKGWLSGAFTGFFGHLYVGSYVVYRLQRVWFGLEGHQLVVVAFCASLGALQIAIAGVLRRLGLPTLVALLAATVVTFFGPGAQSMSWEFMMGANFALALAFGAAFVALREDRTPSAAVGIASLLILSIAADSGVAAFGAVFVGIVVVGPGRASPRRPRSRLPGRRSGSSSSSSSWRAVAWHSGSRSVGCRASSQSTSSVAWSRLCSLRPCWPAPGPTSFPPP